MHRTHRRTAGLAAVAAGIAWAIAPPTSGAAPPEPAPVPRFAITGLVATSCESGGTGLRALTTDMPELNGYLVREQATVDGLAYSDEAADVVGSGADRSYYWSIYDLFTYPTAPSGPRGAWPMPEGRPVTLDFTLEDGVGEIDAWTTVLDRCDGGRIVANGPGRELTVGSAPGRRLAGTLSSYGDARTRAGVPVRLWQRRPGPDRLVGTVRTSGTGQFSQRLGRRTGRFYARVPSTVDAAGRTLAAERSGTVTVR